MTEAEEASAQPDEGAAETEAAPADSAYFVPQECEVPDGLMFQERLETEYSRCFSVDRCEGDLLLITLPEDKKILVVPDGSEVPDGLPEDIIVFQQPADNIYLVASAAADGAYASEEMEKQAEEKNILLVTTGLRGRGPREILTQFKLSDDRHTVIECPEGHKPKTSSYIRQSNSIRVSFPRCCCENCPHQKECNAKINARTSVVFLSLGALIHTEQAIKRKDNEIIKLFGRIRNGVETVPSILRRKYQVDRMPVRGKLKTKKRCLHEKKKKKCRSLQQANT